MENTKYGLRIELPLPYEAAVAKTIDALKEYGFGVLTEIDVKTTLKVKLDADFKKYVILGACNPPLAHQALQAEEEIGLLLPCNVVVFETGSGSSRVAAIDPDKAMQIVENENLKQISEQARTKLVAALARLEQTVAVKT